ncbi:MAG: acetyl-CoA carboxylase carboxyltransferase subunit beta [Clostridiales bacterium]|nr:acetyl-CoA carboxylase carboxyltransferase subunit beta [Clostridiales bacterium]
MKHIFQDKSNGINYRRLENIAPIIECSSCGRNVLEELARTNSSICPFCGNDFRMKAHDRMEQILDNGSFKETNKSMSSVDKLHFPDYTKKLNKYKKSSGLKEAVVTGIGAIDGRKVAIAIMDAQFMMGSMGTVVGQKIVSLTEHATKNKLPLIIFCASGGARMQEGVLSLMQMSRCSIALNRHSEKGLLYISVLTHPTTGGVTASFAMQGDIILAEPGALIGFAGPRVIEQTVKQELPDGFQRSEHLIEHGMIDNIILRRNMKYTLSHLLKLHTPFDGGAL